MNKIKMTIIILLIIILILVITLTNKSKQNQEDLTIYFFNAGKADAILITKNDTTIMIDTGEEELSSTILSYLNNNNITKIDYLILTHFDKDHIGSASTIINNIEIREVLQSNFPKESEYYTAYLNALEEMNLTPTTVSGNYEISLNDVMMTVNGPDTIYDKNESNNSSLIVSLTYKNTSYLFMGDAENQRIKDYLSQNTNTYDLIKIPYHGNYLKRLEELLSSTKPTYGIITASKEAGAEQETLDLLEELKINYYITRDGPIIITSDGETINIQQ